MPITAAAPEEYDEFTLRRPRRNKRISAITGRPTKLTEETELQILCITHYEKRCHVDAQLRHLTRLFAIAPNDGAVPMNKRILAKRMGKKRGPWDAQFYDGRGGKFVLTWVEFKAPDGVLSPEQRDYQAWLSGTPVRTVVVKTLNEFLAVIA